ncbi:hypothetical protein G3N56_19605 [Desulfovibrio sulfodismutans]|uniref:Uncharacterized protein n=1 Tax=Desulfolutivibrio sulfodismutans TaxID=63561 RepID=A0A7K3NRX8_9BACT|nr:hypothetical protein [Desulfolutivibrio sulfodismutans]NDY58948.1 hypothetical protein [Desulfolutivibrio sulfodismutans]QLA10882.1 hypothetical protein GD606_00585 [Desulfolutivibrio sulfodismutans DSM 3696]
MLREGVEWLATPAGWAARGLGLVAETVAMGARYRRCRREWEPHLQRCREAVLRAAQGCPGRGTVVVCGSGYCHDVPVRRLAGMFERVVLADAVHPLRVRWEIRGQGNVGLVETDLTGLLKQAGAWRKGVDVRAIRPVAPEVLGNCAPVLTISANVLSQLALPVKARLMKLGCREEETTQVCRRIVAAHVDWLGGLPGVRCLVTDTVSRDVDENGILEETDLLYGISLPPGGETWTWSLAPRPEVSRRFDRIRQVAAVTWPARPLP